MAGHSFTHSWNARAERSGKGGSRRDNQYKRAERDMVDCAKVNNYRDRLTELFKFCFTAPRQCVLYRVFDSRKG